jgi:hypothetical protein
VHALCSLFALFEQRVFDNSFAINRFRTLFQNCRVAYPATLSRNLKMNQETAKPSLRLTLRVKVTKIRPSKTSRMVAAMQKTKVLPGKKPSVSKPLRGGKKV